MEDRAVRTCASPGSLSTKSSYLQEAMDVSADLHELTRCPVGLVSAGVKSILDIGRTLEYLVREAFTASAY